YVPALVVPTFDCASPSTAERFSAGITQHYLRFVGAFELAGLGPSRPRRDPCATRFRLHATSSCAWGDSVAPDIAATYPQCDARPASPILDRRPGVDAGELRLALHDEPKTLDPLMFADESAEAIRYLTEGVLIRINRLTQQPEAELAVSWKVSENGKRVTFQLRQGVHYPDGSTFTSR